MRAWTTCAAIAFFAAAAHAEPIERTFHETFDVAPGDRLVLEGGDGDVDVRPWDRDVLDVHVVYEGEISEAFLGINRPRDFSVDFERSGRTIRVVGHEPGSVRVGIGWSGHRVHRYLYTIRAPSWLDLEIESDDGDLAVDGWTGGVDIRGEDGDVELSGLAGGILEVRLDDGDLTLIDCRLQRARLSTEDGDLTMRNVEGPVAVESDDGDLELRGVRSTDLSVSLADGDVYLSLLPSAAARVDVRTDDGDVVVVVPDGLSARFSIDTDDGRMEVDLPEVSDLERSRHRVSGRLGGGDGTLAVRTNDGDVTLRRD